MSIRLIVFAVIKSRNRSIETVNDRQQKNISLVEVVNLKLSLYVLDLAVQDRDLEVRLAYCTFLRLTPF